MRAFLCLVILSLLLAACRQVPAGGSAPGLPTSTPTVISSRTSPAATETPVPTQTPAPPTEIPKTATATATPTEAPAKIDLKPNYEQKVSVEYMGVRINTSLITDESLDPIIKKVTVGEKAYAEFVARSLYKVWLKKGGTDGTGPKAETTFEQFMALWSTAQQSGLEADWRQVQIKKIWANDIPTPGYEQHPYTIWFMHEGQTPEDVREISKMSIAQVRPSKLKNITLYENNAYGDGMGTNIDGEFLFIYQGTGPGDFNNRTIASGISGITWWLKINSGRSISGYGSEDNELKKILINGGIKIE